MTLVTHPNEGQSGGRRLANNILSVPDKNMHHSACLKGHDWIKSFLPTLNMGMPAGLTSHDPIATLKSDPMASEMQIEAINAKSTCGYVIKDMKGLKTQRFKDLQVTNDFPCGLGHHCMVCTKGKACGDMCIAKDATCSSKRGCAVDPADMTSSHIELDGRMLRDGKIGVTCRVCGPGKKP